MARTRDGASLGAIGRLFGSGTVLGLDESELLARYVEHRDEAAFEALLRRFGPMVLAVCRRRLGDPRDVEDSFQATFFVLARRAGSIRRPELLGNWLFGVAHRIATKAHRRALRLAARERPEPPEPSVEPDDPAMRREAIAALHEEIGRLPGSYRAVVVLCHLEGHTHDEAARRLGWPVGTVRGRLSRARELLRDRLTRRGLAGLVPLVPTLLGRSEARAALSMSLVDATLRASLRYAAGRGVAAGSVPAAARALAEGVLLSMALHPAKVGLAGLIATAVVASGVGVLAQQSGDEPEARHDSAPPAYDPIFYDIVARPEGVPLPGVDELETRFAVLEARLDAKRSEIRAAEAQVELAKVRHARVDRLASMKRDLVSEEELKEAEAGLAIAEAELGRKKAEYREAEVLLRSADELLTRQLGPEAAQVLDHKHRIAQSEVVRASDRLAWAERMSELGYISKAQLQADRLDLPHAEYNLAQADARLKAFHDRTARASSRDGPEAGDEQTASERDRDEPPGPDGRTAPVEVRTGDGAFVVTASGSLETRLSTIEQKLDRILEALEVDGRDEVTTDPGRPE